MIEYLYQQMDGGSFVNMFSQPVEVRFLPEQVTRLRAIAQAKGTSLDSLIRRAVEDAYLEPDRQAKLEAVRRMAALSLPVADWEQMERESVRECSVG